MTNLESTLKCRDSTLGWTTKVHIVKAMVFPVVMQGDVFGYLIMRSQSLLYSGEFRNEDSSTEKNFHQPI